MADIVDQIIKRKLLIVGIGLSCAAALVLSAAFLVNGPSELSRADRLAAPSAAAALFSASLRSVDRDDKMPIDINAHDSLISRFIWRFNRIGIRENTLTIID